MDIFNSEFLDALRNIAIAVGLLYSPLLFANGILDVMLKFRQWKEGRP